MVLAFSRWYCQGVSIEGSDINPAAPWQYFYLFPIVVCKPHFVLMCSLLSFPPAGSVLLQQEQGDGIYFRYGRSVVSLSVLPSNRVIEGQISTVGARNSTVTVWGDIVCATVTLFSFMECRGGVFWKKHCGDIWVVGID